MAATKKKGKKLPGAIPISERARALNEQIATLESEIKKLDSQIQHTSTPKLRSTAIPHGATIARKTEPPPAAHEPVFEEVKPLRTGDDGATPDQFNELGVRKYDLPALLNRVGRLFKRPTTNNPRLVAYLAAGGVHGLRPMRYEKRVARNRFIALVVFLFLMLLCVIYLFVHNH